MTDLNLTAAIEEAARAMWDHTYEDGMWDQSSHDTDNAQHCLTHAELAVRAALPHIVKAVREQVAQEIEAFCRDRSRWPEAAQDDFLDYEHGLEEAADLARGGDAQPGEEANA
jgi:hypothetical protein